MDRTSLASLVAILFWRRVSLLALATGIWMSCLSAGSDWNWGRSELIYTEVKEYCKFFAKSTYESTGET